MNYLIEFVRQRLGKKDFTDGSIRIQKQILNNKYDRIKQNKLYGHQLIIDCLPTKTSLTKNDNINVIPFKQKTPRLEKISNTHRQIRHNLNR